MERRQFVSLAGSSSIALGLLHAVAGKASAQGLSDREEGCGKFAVVANRIYGTPRWDGKIRVPGTYVLANTHAPKQNSSYVVSLYVQFRRDEGPWGDVPVAPQYASDYRGASGGVRDWIKVEQAALTVCLFVPDRTLYLQEGPVELRHQLRFFDEANRHVPRLDATVRPFRAQVRLAEGERTLFYGYTGPGQLAVDIYDVYDQHPVKLDLGA